MFGVGESLRWLFIQETPESNFATPEVTVETKFLFRREIKMIEFAQEFRKRPEREGKDVRGEKERGDV